MPHQRLFYFLSKPNRIITEQYSFQAGYVNSVRHTFSMLTRDQMRLYCYHAIKVENQTFCCEFELNKPFTKTVILFSIVIIQI